MAKRGPFDHLIVVAIVIIVIVLIINDNDNANILGFILVIVIDSPSPSPTFPLPQFHFKKRMEGDIANNCLMSIDGTDFKIPQMGRPVPGNIFPPTSITSTLPSNIRSESVFWVGTSYGYKAPTQQDCTMVSRFLRRCSGTHPQAQQARGSQVPGQPMHPHHQQGEAVQHPF